MQCCYWIAAAALCATAAGEVPEQRLDAAKMQIQRTITVQQNNAHLGRLAALRTLRDPQLEPLFRSLLTDPQWAMQVHGVLGLAELDPNGLDPQLLLELHPQAREQALLVVLNEGTLPTPRLRTLLTIDTLEPHMQAQLLDEAQHRKLTVDVAQLNAVLTSGDPRAAGRAAMLLAAKGHTRALPTLDGLIMQWEEPRQLEAAFAAMQTLGRHPSADGARWIDDLLEAEARPGPQRFALMTLLTCDRSAADPRWSKAMAEATRHRQRVDLALVRLMAGAPFSDADRSLLSNDPLLNSIADAADAVAANANGSEQMVHSDAIVALVDTGHSRSIEWLLDTVNDHPSNLVQRAMERLIERVPTTGSADATAMDQGLRGAIALHAMAPNRMRQLLANAPDEGPRQQALLLAALQLDDVQLAHVASNLHRIGLSTSDAMTLLLTARWQDHLPNADIDQLGLVMDGTRLSDPLRTQAAWLLLRHTDSHNELLNAQSQGVRP
jgi:hypothetical protein